MDKKQLQNILSKHYNLEDWQKVLAQLSHQALQVTDFIDC